MCGPRLSLFGVENEGGAYMHLAYSKQQARFKQEQKKKIVSFGHHYSFFFPKKEWGLQSINNLISRDKQNYTCNDSFYVDSSQSGYYLSNWNNNKIVFNSVIAPSNLTLLELARKE